MTILINNIDEYISSFPKEIQTLLEQIRLTIRQAAPDAEEAIKYAMPTFVLNGNLVHFLYLTALFDEKECVKYFGNRYREYMKRTKRFIPFII